MTQPADQETTSLLSQPIDRRALLLHGAREMLRLACVVGLGAGGVVSTLGGCVRAPGTARDQFIYISEEKEIAMGISAYHELLRKAPLSDDIELNGMVNRVGQRIAAVAKKPDYQWEFAIIKDDRMINAFALPGGKVAVFTGILKITKNEDGLEIG